jgi:2-polyprenyl-6-methoxyphenol hydroxylase-like FAD-dependent oxidoreductase
MSSILESNSTASDRQETTCCIVGGGPAGAVLSLLLARKGIKVTLLETHRDFDRDFRGDTLHPSVMEIMDELGLAEKLLELPHTKMQRGMFRSNTQSLFGIDFSRLKTKFPYITLMPQARFLEFITQEAAKYPNFKLILGANAQELITENKVIQGVRYKGQGGLHEVKALLTVATDGRNSKLRQLADLHPVSTSTPMDVLWFRLPRHPEEGTGVMARIGKGHMMAMLDRTDLWQIAYLIPKGSYQELRSAGLDSLRQSVAEIVPELRDRVHLLHEWSQVAFLSVESSCLKQWYRPGLLLIGDAAHVMSPVGGVGINYAIQDAVVAANVLTEPLKQGKVELHHLAKIQHQRWLPTRIIQNFQSLIQSRIISRALDQDTSFTTPAFLQLPILKDLPARMIGLGVWRVRVES